MPCVAHGKMIEGYCLKAISCVLQMTEEQKKKIDKVCDICTSNQCQKSSLKSLLFVLQTHSNYFAVLAGGC